MDTASDDNAGGGGASNAGTNSFITTPSKGGKAPTKADGSGDSSGDEGKGNNLSNNSARGDAASDWKSALPKELQEDASLKKFTSLDALAGAYINAQKLIGADKIPVPGKYTTDDEWKEIYKKLGVPEKLEEYDIKFKDGVPVAEEFSKTFKEKAHTLGILPKQAQALAEWFSDSIAQGQQSAEMVSAEEFENNKKALVKEWGNAFDLNINRANKVVNDLGGEELVKMLNDTGAGANPVVLKFLAKIGENLYKEHKFVEGESSNNSYTPKELDTKIGQLRADPAYYDKNHPKHKTIVDEIKSLYDLRYPSNN